MIEQSTSFCFSKGNILTYNDEISVSCPLENLEIEGAVNAIELYDFAKKIKSEEVDLEIKGNELLLKAGRSKAGLTLHAEVTLPVEEIGKISKWKKLPEGFLTALNFTMGSCGHDMTEAIYTCVHINKTVLEATDKYRIASYQLEKKVPVKAFLLPATTCMKLIKMNPVEIAEGNGWIHFKTKNDAVISCRIFEEKFPEVAYLLEVKGNKIEFPKTLIEILDRAEIFSKRDYSLDESVEIHLENKKIKIKSSSDVGWFEEKSRIDYTGDPITFSIAPYLLKDILTQTTTGILTKSVLLFEGDNWKYLSILKSI